MTGPALGLLRDLVAHKGHANAALLTAVRRSEAAILDVEVVELLRHILIANRFWICAVRRTPFIAAREAGTADSLASLVGAFKATHEEELVWMSAATEEDCAATLTDPLIPGGKCSVGEALMQVCMHSHAHRAQLAKMLRRHGVVPPQMDFILWLVERPQPVWDAP